MKSYSAAMILLLLAGMAQAGPYVSYSLETSSSPHRNVELQNRLELGYSPANQWDWYVYHESDPRNGFEGAGWTGETENGAGIRFRYEWDQ